MKKIVCLFLSLCLFLVCGSKPDKVERKIEDGVEVIINHMEPYRVGGASSLRL